MRLKSLYIKGFKSFANETNINFNEPIIGIVGPNGAGKSNIVDAIRWVLGEQKSRELRLEKMVDVIFSGTKTRKMSGVAQVTLTFENTKNILPTEYDQISVSRLLYQSGESEYRLNNVTCRLKDINTLLMDTGIGSNSYAIISLGMVDDILIDKDNSRRKMFEQAAGVSKYKIRKKETLSKLQITSNDLDRVEDLLFEIQQNLKDLEKQAKRTQKYFEIKEEYKVLSIQLAQLKIGGYWEKRNKLDSKINLESDRHGELSSLLNKLESELQKLKSQNLDKEQNLSRFQKELNQLIQDIRKKEYDREILKEKSQFNSKRIEDLTGELESAEHTVGEIIIEHSNLKKSLSELEENWKKEEIEFHEAQRLKEEKKRVFEMSRAEADEFTDSKLRLERDIQEAEKKLAVFENSHTSRKKEIQLLVEDRISIEHNIEDLEKLIIESEKLQLNSAEKLSILTIDKENLDQKIEGLDKELSLEEKKLQQCHRKIDAYRNERNLIKNMVDNLEGYPSSIKFLHQQWKQQYPVLGDILHVQEEYKVSVESFLEPYLNHFVVDNIMAAENGIFLLKSAQKGKAHFFILNSYEKPALKAEVPAYTQAIINFVRVDGKYQIMLQNLLNNVFVTDLSADQIKINNEDERIVIVSKNGEVVRKRHVLSGGSVGLFEGTKIGRKKYLEELEVKLKAKDVEKREIQANISRISNHRSELKSDELQTKIGQLKNDQVKLEQQLISKNNRKQHLIQQRDHIQNRVNQYQEENRVQQKQVVEITDQKLICQTKLETLLLSKGSTKLEVQEIAKQFSEVSAVANQLKIKCIQKENHFRNTQRDAEFRQRRIHEIKEQQRKRKTQVEALKIEVETQKYKANELEQELLDFYNHQKKQSTDLTEAERLYFKAKAEIVEKEDSLRELNKQMTNQQALVNRLKEEHTNLRFHINSLTEKLKIEFNLEKFDIESNNTNAEEDIPVLQEKSDRLKRRLDNYGEINPLAVEAYNEIKIRHDSIEAQKKDIIEAKDTLLETIKEIEETAKDKFMTAFNQVRVNFKNVFRNLFTDDDDCDLVLLDHNSPLESRIEIIAKPKGKRPRTLSQLSGGEKTLTAIALLFSLYLLKPAPFCIFDEVDAPLDDANIQKFNKIINRFSKDSQFIIVTHNKLTMAEVGILYGIYMQEQGISGVSAVDLRDYQHTASLETV